MKNLKLLFLTCCISLTLTGCFDDRDDDIVLTADVKDFIWKGMNEFYLFGDEVPDLRNDRFGINGEDDRYVATPEYLEYLDDFSSPEALFDALVFDAGNTDRFSQLIPDLFVAIDQLNGTTETNGLRRLFGFSLNGSFYVRVGLVLNGSNADLAGVRRNMVISGVDGTQLTEQNAENLLAGNTITLNFADYDDNGTEDPSDDVVTPNGQSATVTREEFTDNPVHRVEVIEEANETIGYIMYNSFRANFETELNAAFAELQAANVEHLVLDLRYNGGGAIVTATRLASMITGQFNNQIFAKNINGPNRQDQNINYNFTNTIEGGASINSLGLSKIYVITTSSSASASELLINSLRPYGVEVVQVGTTTTGKTSSNRLVFDSPDFGTTQVTSAHTYALFPLIGNVINSNDMAVPSTGLVPNIEFAENSTNLGTLGDPNEPLLQRAIQDITGTGRLSFSSNTSELFELKSKKFKDPMSGYMFDNR